jgi:hypothetical protein
VRVIVVAVGAFDAMYLGSSVMAVAVAVAVVVLAFLRVMLSSGYFHIDVCVYIGCIFERYYVRFKFIPTLKNLNIVAWYFESRHNRERLVHAIYKLFSAELLKNKQ